MVRRYRKYFTRKRERGFKGPFKRRYGFTRQAFKDTYTVASKALSIAKQVKGLINVEWKHLDTTVAANLTNTPTINYLTKIAQGDGESSRDGNSVKLKSLQFRYQITGNSSAEATYARIIVGIDKLHSGTDVTAAGTSDNSLLTAQTNTATRDLANKKRFIILYDRVHSISNTSKEVLFRQYFKKFNMKVEFNGVNNTDMRSNHLFIVAFSDLAANYPSWRYNTRIRFLDN